MASTLIAQQPSFDVASIKPTAPGTKQRILIEPGGRFFAQGFSLKFLIAAAWHLASYQLSGGENWTASQPWTVEAVAEGIAVTPWMPPFFPEAIAARVRSLLSDRFALQAHHETREMAVYRLSIGKNGSRLEVTPSAERPQTVGRPEDPVPAPGRAMAGPGAVLATAIPVQQLVILLGRWMDRSIIDKTGLNGFVDVKLRFAPESAPHPLQVPPSPDGAVSSPGDDPSIFTALEEQLGLKLEPARESIDVLVIDSARRPVGN
ncbi:MAG TPA: TIGR03435 family protein [Bryobacteraceae bacterium]|nr:TIGR03435 family protein [Bryobacteraceae bacterium]